MIRSLLALYERFAINAYATGEFEKAERWLRRIENAEGESARVLRNRGVVALADGRMEEARLLFLREEELYGESYYRHLALADLAWAEAQGEEAARRYAAALADDDSLGTYVAERPFLKVRLDIAGNPERFSLAMEGAAQYRRGNALRDAATAGEGRRAALEAAVEAFREAARMDPSHWPALNNAGALLLNELGAPEAAAACFKAAAAIRPSPTLKTNIELALAAAADASGAGKQARSQRNRSR